MIGKAAAIGMAGALVFAAAAQAEPKSETRDLKGFTGIDMHGAAQIDIKVGPAESVVVEAEPETLAKITTEVKNGVLVIGRKEGSGWFNGAGGKIAIHITMPKLASFGLDGAADTTITGLNGGATSFALNGTGNLKVMGKVDTLALNLNGTGNADCGGLAADAATVAVNGVGSVRVKAAHELTASVNGLGSIVYEGTPTRLASSINGLGTIHQAQ